MIQAAAERRDMEVRLEFERRIDASPEQVFEALVEDLGPGMSTPDGESLHMELEPFPGGRWWRDLGDGDGHFWAHVQAIKRPALLELCGPLFMSRPVSNNVQYRLEADGDGTVLRLVHEAFGPLPDELLDRMPEGWEDQLDRIAARFA